MRTLTPNSTGVDATSRLVALLTDTSEEPVTLTRAQLAYLMGAAMRWGREAEGEVPSELTYRAGYDKGYQDRVAEENTHYPPPPHNLLYRERVPMDTQPRPNDYRGGPVEVWD